MPVARDVLLQRVPAGLRLRSALPRSWKAWLCSNARSGSNSAVSGFLRHGCFTP